jgi:hypothetical protein
LKELGIKAEELQDLVEMANDMGNPVGEDVKFV